MIRLLDSEKDRDVLVEAWNWRESAPKWFRESLEIFKESKEEYLEAAPRELHFGVFAENEATAVIRLVEEKPWVFCIHLSARRKTDFNLVLEAGLALRDYLFSQGVQSFYGWLPTVNRGVSKLYESLGFSDTGIRVFKGTIRGKTGVFRHYALVNPKMLLKTSE